MLRSTFRNASILNAFNNNLIKYRFCSKVQLSEYEQNEYNNVKLLGTIASNSRTLPNGVKSIIVRTVENDRNYCNHHVNVRSEDIFKAGERVYIFGSLSARQFSLDDGKLRQKLVVKAKYFRLRGHTQNSDEEDVNNIKISAKISSDIRHTDKYSLFTLITSHIPKGEGRIQGLTITEFHRVIVYDHPALGVVRNSIEKLDHVLVEGKIGYQKYKNVDGKVHHGGYIIANSVQRLEL